MSDVNQQVTKFKQGMDSLVDEESETLLIHYVDGNPNNKFVIGSKGKGKTPLTDRLKQQTKGNWIF